jgi:hypothetical protein
MRLNAPLLTFLAITRPKPDRFTCQKYAKNLIIYKSFMIFRVWLVGTCSEVIVSRYTRKHVRKAY